MSGAETKNYADSITISGNLRSIIIFGKKEAIQKHALLLPHNKFKARYKLWQIFW